MAAFRIFGCLAARRRLVLLDLGFLEDDVLAGDRVVLLELQLFGRGARVLARDVVVAGVGRTHELDHDRRLLGHRAPRLPRPGKWKGGKIQRGHSLSSEAWVRATAASKSADGPHVQRGAGARVRWIDAGPAVGGGNLSGAPRGSPARAPSEDPRLAWGGSLKSGHVPKRALDALGRAALQRRPYQPQAIGSQAPTSGSATHAARSLPHIHDVQQPFAAGSGEAGIADGLPVLKQREEEHIGNILVGESS